MKLYTIGFTGTSVEGFFGRLQQAGVKRIVDVRLNNTSQLAGFSKKDDLAFFLRSILGVEYVHLTVLTPTQDLLDTYRKQKGSWADYERSFAALLAERAVERELNPELFDEACLLCSEPRPEQCHRRVVAEYFEAKWGNVEIVHL